MIAAVPAVMRQMRKALRRSTATRHRHRSKAWPPRPPDSDDQPNTTIITPDGQPAHAEAASTADHQSVPSSGAAFEESKAEPLPEVKSLVDHDATAATPVAAALHASLAERLATA